MIKKMQDNLYNLSFERTLLCSIIYEPILYEELTIPIKEDDFYLPAHSDIFKAIKLLASKDLPIDEEFLKRELLKLNKFDEEVMLHILTANPASKIDVYCEEVKEKSKQRELLQMTNVIKKSVVEDMSSSDETIAEIHKELKSMEEDSSTGIKIRTLREAGEEAKSMPIMPKYETGMKVVDSHFDGGLELSQLIMVGGEKGSGKTAFSLQFLNNVSLGHKSSFLSFEMPWYKIQARQYKHKPNDTQLDNLSIVDDGRDIFEIERTVRKLARSGTKFFGIDSLMKIRNKQHKGKRHEQIGDITDRLSKLCMDHNIIIMLIVQVNNEDQKSGRMAVKGSGDADYDADIMFFIQKDKDDHRKRLFLCEKNRQNGNEFKEEMYFNPQRVMLQEHAPSAYEIAYTSTIYDTPKIEMEVL